MPKWIQRLNKIDDGLEKIERGAAVVLFTLLMGMICGNILARNALHISAYRLLELAPAVVLWLALTGATLALKHQRHIKIELVLRFLPATARRLAVSLTSLFAMVVCIILAYTGVAFLRNEIELLGARGWQAGCLVIFFALAGFRFFMRLLQPWYRDRLERP